MRIGVICEGSHDFIALRAIFESISLRRGKAITAFDAIQPRVDATSSVQIGGGGWHRVKVWLEDNNGAELKKILSPRLFSTSSSYDVLLIHMDGDVVWLNDDFNPAVRAECFHNTPEVVKTIEDFIESTLQPPDELDDYIIYAVPVMHTECWLIAASTDRPFRRNIEHFRTKAPAKRLLKGIYATDISASALTAATKLGENLEELRKKYASLEHFAAKVESVFN